MSFQIEITDLALKELAAIKVHYRKQIIQSIDDQLTHDPAVETRNRKRLEGVQPTFEHATPVWELRVGEYRVYYDINSQESSVIVRSVRRKPPHLSTEQVI